MVGAKSALPEECTLEEVNKGFGELASSRVHYPMIAATGVAGFDLSKMQFLSPLTPPPPPFPGLGFRHVQAPPPSLAKLAWCLYPGRGEPALDSGSSPLGQTNLRSSPMWRLEGILRVGGDSSCFIQGIATLVIKPGH